MPAEFRLIDTRRKRICTTPIDHIPPCAACGYIWGDIEQTVECLSFTSDKISYLKRTSDIFRLPATIEDTVEVCKRIGCQYLWADRYCILQDDAEDKARQLGCMSSIFSAADLVVIACSGNSMVDRLPGISRPRRRQLSQDICKMRINVQIPPLWDVVGTSVWNITG